MIFFGYICLKKKLNYEDNKPSINLIATPQIQKFSNIFHILFNIYLGFVKIRIIFTAGLFTSSTHMKGNVLGGIRKWFAFAFAFMGSVKVWLFFMTM